MNSFMSAKDAPAGSMAECYVTIDGTVYNFMQLYSFESKFNVNITDVPILGRVNKGHKYSGGSGEWSGTAHYNQSIMREIMYKYQEFGEITYFDIQVTNEDPATAVGRQTIILLDCLCDSTILAKYDADSENLTEELSGTFERFEMPEKFKVLEGMV
jgi:hypothetical protein